MHIEMRGDEVTDVKLTIYEPPRFFEGFMQGRDYSEAPDITARICGICPVAYQMSSVYAMEDAFGVEVDGVLRELRRLLYCGEWIESHVLHVYLLHLPDFLGFESAIHMAKDHGETVAKALRLKKAGNAIVSTLAGREIHPINVKVGGFYRAPTKQELGGLLEELEWSLGMAEEMVRFTAGLSFPDFEKDYEFVALRHPEEYPCCEGKLVSNRGLDIPISEFREHFVEIHEPHSTALHCKLKERGMYFVGPLARYNLNFDKLPENIQELALEIGLGKTCRNPFKGIIIRSVETLYAVQEALRIIKSYEPPAVASVPVEPRESVGHGCTEAPRGILYHRYELAEDGSIRHAQIVPPTAQNLPTIEDDLRQYVTQFMALPDSELKWQCEQAVRNYDPCISCSTHFLKLTIDRK